MAKGREGGEGVRRGLLSDHYSPAARVLMSICVMTSSSGRRRILRGGGIPTWRRHICGLYSGMYFDGRCRGWGCQHADLVGLHVPYARTGMLYWWLLSTRAVPKLVIGVCAMGEAGSIHTRQVATRLLCDSGPEPHRDSKSDRGHGMRWRVLLRHVLSLCVPEPRPWSAQE